jgi:hypothetical protein
MQNVSNRWGPLAGLLSVVCCAVGALVAINQPQETDSNAKISAYFSSHSHDTKAIVGFFVFLAGLMLLLVFLASVRDRLAAAGDEGGRVSGLAFGAGVASIPLWGVSMLLAFATAFASNESSTFRVDPDTFRLLSASAYMAWVAALILSAIVVWAVSVVALRTGILPRWHAWFGLAAGAVQLLGYFVFPFLAWWLWIVVTSALLLRRRLAVGRTVPQPAV